MEDYMKCDNCGTTCGVEGEELDGKYVCCDCVQECDTCHRMFAGDPDEGICDECWEKENGK